MNDKKTQAWTIGWAVLVATVSLARAAAGPEPLTHEAFQAVDDQGRATWFGALPETLTGIVLNAPAEMLDTSPGAPGPMGGQMQFFIQGLPGDEAGTALWMGQNYAIFPWGDANYTDAAWSGEMARVASPDGRPLARGDLVEVTLRTTSDFGGKHNVTESHQTASGNDFDVVLLEAGAGLPAPVTIPDLAALRDENDEDLFDATGATGGEHYQGRRVRIDDVWLTDASGWGQTSWAARVCTISDATGRTFPRRMPRGVVQLGGPPAPGQPVDIVGIMNQESGMSLGTAGYEIFVQDVIGKVPGDASFDGAVDVTDLAILAAHWNQARTVAFGSGDFSGDGEVDVTDLAILAANWDAKTKGAAVPAPPAAWALAVGAGLIVRRRRRR